MNLSLEYLILYWKVVLCIGIVMMSVLLYYNNGEVK
jgi:uncharacterized protein (UPF0333 family)